MFLFRRANLQKICSVLIIWTINSQSIIAATTDDITCVKVGQIKWYENNFLKTQKKDYCFNTKRFEIESSECAQNINCKAHQYQSVPFDKIFSKQGSPGFKLCSRFYNSTPKDIKFKAKKEWVSVSICIFPDGQFIDIPRLMARSR